MFAEMLLTGCGSDSGSDFDTSSSEINPEQPFVIANACGAQAPAAQTASITGIKAAAVPPGGAAITVQQTFAALSFERPLSMQQAPDDERCWFIVEQSGRVQAFINDPAADRTNLFIDISNRVEDGPNEAGLLGLAFHPNYASNGQVFLSYTADDGGLVSRISRFTTTDNGVTLSPDTEEILLTLSQPFGNHNGGNIVFGPDGYLYIGFGDGGSANDPGERSQNTLNLFGSLLRIDVDGGAPYGIPGDNPFAGNSLCSNGFGAADCPEIYAYGLRNPWRFSFDRQTGDIWLGDVGQNAIEEIDIIEAGGNYGWPFFEGTRCNTEAPVLDCNFNGIPPITEYGRAAGHSVTGGYLYRGSNIPDLAGAYVYADFVSGTIFQYFDPGSGTPIESQTPTDLFIASFAEALDGELYLLDLTGGNVYELIAD